MTTLGISFLPTADASEAEADRHGCFDPFHILVIDAAEIIGEPLFVYGAKLFQKNGGRALQKIVVKGDVSRLSDLLLYGCDRRHDGSGAESVPDIVLQDENRTNAALARSRSRETDRRNRFRLS